jgi:hypothetical protein
MKKVLTAISVMVMAVLLMCVASQATAAPPPVSIKLLNPPKKGLLELAVGESYTFDIEITSDEPFLLAIAMTDQYYPGRGVFWHGSDRASQATSALLHLTITGKKSTADLAAVCDWPEPGYCWPEGVAPVSIVVGARYEGGLTFSERFPFAVVVP